MCPLRSQGLHRTARANGRPNVLNSLFLHFRPTAVPERTLRLTLTWGLGGAATALVLILVVTGLLLKFVFEPVPERAYESILYLQKEVPFGQLVRNLHRWSGNILVLATFLHSLRVFYTGATDWLRRANWLIGMGLFAVIVMANFTGYLLPWDQIAYWAVTISTSMLDYVPLVGSALKDWALGGPEPGATTLLNFYALHTAILPVLLVLVLPFHFWRVRKAAGLVVPRTPEEAPGSGMQMVPVIPHLVARELALGLILLAVLLLYSMFFNAPLAETANPGLSPNPTKAPWYFMGFQELLLHFHPLFSVVVIPALLSGGVLFIPWLLPGNGAQGVWFASRRGRRLVAVSAAVALLATFVGVLADEVGRSTALVGAPAFISRGLLPLAIIIAACIGYLLLVRRVSGATREEMVQALFTLAVTSFITLTVIGIWFRGAGMRLTWAG